MRRRMSQVNDNRRATSSLLGRSRWCWCLWWRLWWRLWCRLLRFLWWWCLLPRNWNDSNDGQVTDILLMCWRGWDGGDSRRVSGWHDGCRTGERDRRVWLLIIVTTEVDDRRLRLGRLLVHLCHGRLGSKR